MTDDSRQPLSIFGIRIKHLLFCLILSAVLLVSLDRFHLKELVTNVVHDTVPGPETAADSPPEITATPAMIEQARREIFARQTEELEVSGNYAPDARFYYIVELKGGSDLEAVELEITPDSVTLISAGGTHTTVPRSSVTSVSKIRLKQ